MKSNSGVSCWSPRGFIEFCTTCKTGRIAFRDRPIQPLSHLTTYLSYQVDGTESAGFVDSRFTNCSYRCQPSSSVPNTEGHSREVRNLEIDRCGVL